MPVSRLIAARLPGSLELPDTALAFALLIGIAAGVLMASFAGRTLDRFLSVVTLLFYSVPGVWIGLMLIVVLSAWLGWLPSGGAETIGADMAGWAAIKDRLRHLILPAGSLALFFIAIYARLVRASMLEVRDLDYIRTAAAKGLSQRRRTLRHMLWNAVPPLTTVAGMHVGAIPGGAVVVETVFSRPGLGRLAVEAVLKRDFSVPLYLGRIVEPGPHRGASPEADALLEAAAIEADEAKRRALWFKSQALSHQDLPSVDVVVAGAQIVANKRVLNFPPGADGINNSFAEIRLDPSA